MTEARAPPPVSADRNGGNVFAPWELNPDLAASKLIADVVAQNGPMGNVSKLFVVWWGIWKGLNDPVGQTTYYDCTLRERIYENVFIKTVHINGSQNEKLWQWGMKPKMIVQGLSGQNTFEEEEKPGIFSRFFGRFIGGGNKNDTNNGN